MKRMLIAAHGAFAEGLFGALSLIMGKRENITWINAFITDTPLETQIDQYAASLGKEDQVIVVTDAFFGSVNQKLMEKKLNNSLMVTGANLPLVLELVTLLDADAPVSVKQLEETAAQAREQLMVVKTEEALDSTDDFDF